MASVHYNAAAHSLRDVTMQPPTLYNYSDVNATSDATYVWCNGTAASSSTVANCTAAAAVDTDTFGGAPPLDTMTAVSVVLYALICCTGLIGNLLVIFVVLRYSKMKTPTNMYILNLAVADLCFLIGLPFLIVTSVLRTWVFGYWMCKVFYVCTSINWYTSVFMLTAMSADRYFAVCHAIQSLQYRTARNSLFVCVCVWFVSIITMLPMILYTRTETTPNGESCVINWPDGPIPRDKAFIWYAFLLGFFIPTALICVFYVLVLMKLYSMGPAHKSKERKKSNRKVSRMVLAVIAVYVCCWLPYWVFQFILNHHSIESDWVTPLFQAITVLSYANSMMNPLLYAFLSDNFRVSFVKAFKCATAHEVNNHLHADMSMAANGHRGRSRYCVSAAANASNQNKANLALLNAPAAAANDVSMVTQGIELSHCPIVDTKGASRSGEEAVAGTDVMSSAKRFVKAENGVHVSLPLERQSTDSDDNETVDGLGRQ